jgi:hypothetical protein
MAAAAAPAFRWRAVAGVGADLVAAGDENQRSQSERRTAAPAGRCRSRCNLGPEARRANGERRRHSVRRSSSERRDDVLLTLVPSGGQQTATGVQLGGRGSRKRSRC